MIDMLACSRSIERSNSALTGVGRTKPIESRIFQAVLLPYLHANRHGLNFNA